MANRAVQFWLMKSEQDVYSIENLEKDGVTLWDGVRNYQARNFMRDRMAIGDTVLFYHSSTDLTGVAGLGRVASNAYPDPTQFDRTSEYYDPGSSKDDPRWWLVDVAFVEKFSETVSLATLKATPELKGMLVLQRGQRLSVQPVEPDHARKVIALAKAAAKAPAGRKMR
jgi:predicted RNA-binding protein with PUA-like domain